MADSHDDIADWAGRAQTGDERAFARLVESHYRVVWALAFAVTGDGSAADDVAQETFLVAWTELARLRAPGAFPMWIRTIARNLSRNWLRSQGYRRRLAERYGAEATDVAAPGPDAAAIRDERRERILEALRALSPRIREVMVLFYLEEKTVADIAAALNLSETAVKSRLFQGRNRLRDALASGWERDFKDSVPVAQPGIALGRIMSGLVLGPAVPEIGKAAAGSGLSMWWQEWLHHATGKTLDTLAQGGLVVSTKKAGIAMGVALILGAGTWVSWKTGVLDPLLGSGITVKQGTVLNDGTVRYGDLSESDGAPPVDDDTASATPESPATSEARRTDGATPAAADESIADAFLAAFDTSGGTSAQAMTALKRRLRDKNRIEDEEDFASISGRVVDLQGNPLPGAVVSAFTPGGDKMEPSEVSPIHLSMAQRDPGHLRSAVTDGAGMYTIEDIAYKGVLIVQAQKAGFFVNDQGGRAFLDIAPGDTLAGIDFILEPGVTLYGRVLDPGGAPVTDATIFCLALLRGGSTRMGNVNNARTDEAGNFFMTFDQAGVLTLEVVSTSRGQTTFDGIAFIDGDSIELVLQHPAAMEGIITYPGDMPAAGLAVTLSSYWTPGQDRHRTGGTVLDADTDAHGYYRIEGADPGAAYFVTVLSADGQPLTPRIDIPPFDSGETRVWDYTLDQPIRVAGTVYGQVTGQPLRDIIVAVRRPGDTANMLTKHVADDGSYTIEILDGSGEYHIFPKFIDIDPNDYGYPSGEVVTLAAGEERTLDLTMVDPVTASVQVVDLSGNPMAGLKVGIWEADSNRMPVGTTDADGRWTFHGFVPTVPIAMEVRGPDGQRAKTVPQTGEPGTVFPEQLLTLYQTGGLQGRIVDGEGNPVARTEFRITAAYGAGNTTYVDQTTDERGHFVVTGGIPATTVGLTAEGEDPRTGAPLRWTRDSVTIEADVLMPLGDVVAVGGAAPPPGSTVDEDVDL